MSVGLGVPSASALFFNMCMFSPRMQRDHCILLTIRIDIKRPLENETLHLVSYPLKKKGRREDIFFFFFLLSPIMIISSGSKKFDQSSSDSRSRLVKRNRNRLCFLSQPPSKDASNDTEESDKNNEMG